VAAEPSNEAVIRSIRHIGVLVAILLSGGCAIASDTPDHQFSFNAGIESPEIEVLDYRYGNSKLPSASNPDYLRAEGSSLQGTNIHGPMLRGDFLYVKWRVKATGRVYEDRVDLRHRLPVNLTDYQIHFVVKGAQLYVNLISPERISGNCPYANFEESKEAIKKVESRDMVLFMYCYRKVSLIYPDRHNANNS
jgi:hypothetical protein